MLEISVVVYQLDIDSFDTHSSTGWLFLDLLAALQFSARYIVGNHVGDHATNF